MIHYPYRLIKARQHLILHEAQANPHLHGIKVYQVPLKQRVAEALGDLLISIGLRLRNSVYYPPEVCEFT